MVLLARRAYSVGELVGKLLEKGHAPEACGKAAQWLLELGYLNDETYAQQLAYDLANKGYGYFRVRRELLDRALDAELVETVCDDLPEAAKVIDSLIVTMVDRRDPDDNRQRRRLADAIYRRGFAWDDIHEGLRRYYDEVE